MFSCLLKRVLPFTLTFIMGAVVGGLFKAHSAGPVMWTWPYSNATPLLGHEGPFGYGHSCRMRARSLVAETKPLVIRFIPDAHWPHSLDGEKGEHQSALVRVTFGADRKVQQVEPVGWPLAWRLHEGEPIRFAVESAARQIQFEPEMINSVPVSVTKEVEVHFLTN